MNAEMTEIRNKFKQKNNDHLGVVQKFYFGVFIKKKSET